MSTFYGTLRGARGPATRCGTASSGISVAAQSYDGSVITRLTYNDKDELMVDLSTADYSTAYGGWGDPGFYGTMKEFKELLTLKKQIDSGEVSIVRHRKKKTA